MNDFTSKRMGGALLVFSGAALALLLTASGCSSNDGAADSGSTDGGDSGSNNGGDSGTKVDAGDSGTVTPTGVCSQAEFDANDFIKFGAADVSQTSADGNFVFKNPCVKIKVGQKVNYQMNFASHKLVPTTTTAGPNPIPTTSSGTDVSVTFTGAGTFGYKCEYHSTMKGEVQVVP